MKKCIMSVCTAILFVFLTACRSTAVSEANYGDEVGRNTLRICIDPGAELDDYELSEFLNELCLEIKNACGIESLTFEVLPSEGAERKTAQTRIRTEMMSGGGPDVFIMKTVAVPSVTGVDIEALFRFPEKNMETGLFLPLDEYMANETQFTDWDAQTKAILNAGRIEEGQMIIPTTYTFPVLVYPENENIIPYTTELTMQEILNNPTTSQLGTLLYSGVTKVDERATDILWISPREPSFLFGKYADYEKEKLLLTELELQEMLSVSMRCFAATKETQEQYMQYQFIKDHVSYSLISEIYNAYFNNDMSLVPMYSINGGVTASVRSFAAVNRNTNFPKESFAVIDYIMQEESQRESVLYSRFFVDSIPLQNDLGSSEKPLESTSKTLRYLEDPLFEDLLLIKDQITAVNFESELDAVLNELVASCSQDESFSDAGVAESYAAYAYEKMERMIGE